MDKFSSILTLIGVVVLVFSSWSFFSIQKYIKQSKSNSRNSSVLADQKYFELKSKLDFIVAVATILFAEITFLGYSSIDNLRAELDKQFQSQKDSINILNTLAIKQFKNQKDSINELSFMANESYMGLEKISA